jgi:predicted HTH domain antitoxin
MADVTITIPDDAALALHLSADRLGPELRLLAAVKLYELGRLSSGAAARLAGVPRVLFLARLADYGVETFRLTEDELLREARLA